MMLRVSDMPPALRRGAGDPQSIEDGDSQRIVDAFAADFIAGEAVLFDQCDGPPAPGEQEPQPCSRLDLRR